MNKKSRAMTKTGLFVHFRWWIVRSDVLRVDEMACTHPLPKPLAANQSHAAVPGPQFVCISSHGSRGRNSPLLLNLLEILASYMRYPGVRSQARKPSSITFSPSLIRGISCSPNAPCSENLQPNDPGQAYVHKPLKIQNNANKREVVCQACFSFRILRGFNRVRIRRYLKRLPCFLPLCDFVRSKEIWYLWQVIC